MKDFLQSLEVGNGRVSQHVQTKRILQYLLKEGGKSIPEIRDFSKLSLPTTTKLVNELVEQKILIESGKKESTGGRPASMFSLNASVGYIVGVELLLNSFRFSIINLNNEVMYEYETDNFDVSKRQESLDFILKSVPELIRKKNIPEHKILGVGIGITGRVNSKKGISYSYLHFETPLTKTLEAAWGHPVFIDNDTRLMTLGEQNFGLGRDKDNVIFINLSQGLGIGFILNGGLYNGHSGFAGELGHIHFEDNDRLCVCGKKGCLETVVSGAALENLYNQQYLPSTKLKYRDVFQLIHTGNFEARNILIEMGEKLGQAISLLVQTLNPNLIVIGGSFAEVGETLLYPIMKGVSLYGLPQLVADCDIKISTLGDKSTMLGAYTLVIENVFA